MLCHSARYVLDSYQYVSPILGLFPMILTRGIHIFGPLPKALLTSGTKVNFLHEGWVLSFHQIECQALGEKICRCKNQNWFPRFFSWFVTTPGWAPVISGQPHHSTRYIFQGHFFGALVAQNRGVFPSFCWFRNQNPYRTPCEHERKSSPFQKESFNPTPHRINVQRAFFRILVGGWNMFFSKITQSLKLQSPRDSTNLSGFFIT